jgi:hypothetical protein
MPMIYGEGRRAFRRLQEEIVKGTDDYSLFAWGVGEWQDYNEYGLLASWPSDFKNAGNIVPYPGWISGTFALENLGIRIQVPLSPRSSFPIAGYPGADYLATLGCHIENNFWDILVLPLKKCENGKFVRIGECSPLRLPRDMWMRSQKGVQHITIQGFASTLRQTPRINHLGITLFPWSRRNYILSEVYPPGCWNETRKIILPTGTSAEDETDESSFTENYSFNVGLLLIEGRKRLVLYLKRESFGRQYCGISFQPETPLLKICSTMGHLIPTS